MIDPIMKTNPHLIPAGRSAPLLVWLCLAAFVLPEIGRSAGAISLFNGKDLSGWNIPAGEWQVAQNATIDAADNKKFAIEAGTGVLVNGASGKTQNLLSTVEHGDVEAHIEFVVPKNSNSGIYFMGRYEIQVFDSWGVAEPKSSDCGGVYASCSEPKPDFKGSPPSVNASKRPGEGQSFDVVFRAPRFDAAGTKTESAKFIKVVHNGRVIHENVEAPRPTCAARWLDEKATGPLMLQGDHGPVAYRNLRLKPVNVK
jgi:hypothetical protein